MVEYEGAEIGLHLNRHKSEIICSDADITGTILPSLPGAQVVDPAKATLLGSSVGDVSSISDILTSKINMLKRMGDRLQFFSAHDAFLLLKHSFALPKLLYNLRTSPCFLSPVLQEYDKSLMSILGQITNLLLSEDGHAWTQATLPVKMGGLGVRSAVQLHAMPLLPFWPQLLPPPTWSTTSSLPICMALQCPTWLTPKFSGPKVTVGPPPPPPPGGYCSTAAKGLKTSALK